MKLRLFGSMVKRRRLRAAVVGNAGLVEIQVGRSLTKLSIREAIRFESELQRALDLARLQKRVMRIHKYR